jgi:hypothetical protein
MEILLQKTLFAEICEIFPLCEPKGLKVIHPEDGGYMFV